MKFNKEQYSSYSDFSNFLLFLSHLVPPGILNNPNRNVGKYNFFFSS